MPDGPLRGRAIGFVTAISLFSFPVWHVQNKRTLPSGQNGRMTLDLTGYFDRIGYRGVAEPNLDVLRGLVTAHTERFRSRTSIR